MAVDDERIGYVAGRLAEALERPLTGAGLTVFPSRLGADRVDLRLAKWTELLSACEFAPNWSYDPSRSVEGDRARAVPPQGLLKRQRTGGCPILRGGPPCASSLAAVNLVHQLKGDDIDEHVNQQQSIRGRLRCAAIGGARYQARLRRSG